MFGASDGLRVDCKSSQRVQKGFRAGTWYVRLTLEDLEETVTSGKVISSGLDV